MRRIRQLEVVMQINLSELFTTEGMQKQYQIPIEMESYFTSQYRRLSDGTEWNRWSLRLPM